MDTNCLTVSLGIAPFDILVRGNSITMRSSYALDSDSVRSGVRLAGHRCEYRFIRSTEVELVLPKDLPCGYHRLLVDGLVSKKGKTLSELKNIPFLVVDTNAEIPKKLSARHLCRLRIHRDSVERIPLDAKVPGTCVDVVKAIGRKNNKPITLAFDSKGRSIDLEKILDDLKKYRLQRHGKMHPALAVEQAKVATSTRIPVALWLRCDRLLKNRRKPSRGRSAAASQDDRARKVAITKCTAAFVVELHRAGLDFRADRLAPVVYADLLPKELKALLSREDIVGAFLNEVGGIDDLKESMAAARSTLAQTIYGLDGSGVRVAIWEDAPDDSTYLSIAASYESVGVTKRKHSRVTHAIVKNIENVGQNGHAPNCDLYSANMKTLDALSWAAESGCTVISQSFHRVSDARSGELSYTDIYKDFLALEWPYPLIVQAAGNLADADQINPPEEEFVNHKGYNGLTVGNHYHDFSDMSDTSTFRNPLSDHGDRELPEIVANGTGIQVVGSGGSGTSLAAPAVAGCAALLQQAAPLLRSWPEGCRAILLASARRNISDGEWWHDLTSGIDGSDGAGAVNAFLGAQIVKSRSRPGAFPRQAGWDVGGLLNDSFDATNTAKSSYFIGFPFNAVGPMSVRVALAWDSRVTWVGFDRRWPVSSKLMVDLDLEIYDSSGALVGYSGSFDNSYEIAEFEAKSGEIYEIKIRRWGGKGETWFGIAWCSLSPAYLISTIPRALR